MMIMRNCAMLALLLLLQPVARAQSSCNTIIPVVDGVDQSATDPSEYGKCIKVQAEFLSSSHWCTFGKLGTWPGAPEGKAQQCLKFGRASVYRGPIYGSSPNHRAACNKVLKGDDKYAFVAVSTKYLRTDQGGWTSDQGACNKCMCVRMHGADTAYNSGLQPDVASKHIGLTFLARVGDRCSECPDDQIDILQDRPFSWAPFDPTRPSDNPNAVFVNAKDGLRGFKEPETMRNAAEAVGTWTANWQFVPCESYSHAKCVDLMSKDMGMRNVSAPSFVQAYDSFSLKPLAVLSTRPFGPDPSPADSGS